jgi:hypothetical protein
MATSEDHEARTAALEASQADYRAVLAAVNVLGANQREHSLRLSSVETRLSAVEDGLSGVKIELVTVNGHLRSVDEHLAEIRDLIVGERGR